MATTEVAVAIFEYKGWIIYCLGDDLSQNIVVLEKKKGLKGQPLAKDRLCFGQTTSNTNRYRYVSGNQAKQKE